MERKTGRAYRILNLLAVFLTGCTRVLPATDVVRTAEVAIEIGWGHHYISKAALPDETQVSDISLMIFDEAGFLEREIYLYAENGSWDNNVSTVVTLLNSTGYTFCACANFGYPVSVARLEDLNEVTYHMTYPDEYRKGIPMYALKDAVISAGQGIRLDLTRLMARIDVRMDRSELDEDISLEVTGVRIGNCPKKVRVFKKSRAESEDDCFPTGFSHRDEDCRPLNMISHNGMSEGISLYMLENMQGDFSQPPISSHTQKVFGENDIRKRICSYIEIQMEYSSGTKYSASKPLIYRFYLGEDANSLDMERNCLYTVTIVPQGDGLSGSGWRIDKSGISYKGTPYLNAYPSSYIRGDIGDSVHVWCEVFPPDAPFDVGLEYMIADKSEGVYDYRIDDDGHGAVLTFTGPGSGLIYMEAGEPVNDAALFVIEVNLP